MSETVLIVDDDPVQRRLLEAMVAALRLSGRWLAEGGDAAVAPAHRPERRRASTAWCSTW